MSARENNQNRITHGGESAIESLRQGKPFARYVHQTYLEVLEDMGLTEADLTGTIGLAAREVARQFTASTLFWQAAMSAAEDGNLKDFERFMQRFGWMSGKATKGMEAYFEIARDKNVIDYEQVLKGQRDD